MNEFSIDPNLFSDEMIQKAKEGMTAVISDSSINDIKLVGVSLIFLDIKNDVCMQQRFLSKDFDSEEYDL